MHEATKDHALSKVPEITLGFWIIKIAATTLSETEEWAPGYAARASICSRAM